MEAYPVPNTKGYGKKYWDELVNNRFCIPFCESCNEYYFYPRIMCPHCSSQNVTFKEHNGLGEIYSFTVVQRTIVESFEKDVPYTMALVQIDDNGTKMMTRIIDCEPSKVYIGMKVKLKFHKMDNVTLPFFVPDERRYEPPHFLRKLQLWVLQNRNLEMFHI
jgi:uncharacterized OB-fold protein